MKAYKLGLLIFLFALLPGVSQAALEDYFVDTQWLAANRDHVVVLDVRKAPLYWLGHIDGALNVEKERFLETRNEVKSLVPTAAAFQNLMSSLGLTTASTVVVYAEDDNPYAARLVWTLRYHGHQKAFVLDGGYDKWSMEGRNISLLPTKTPEASNYAFAVDGDYLEARADADYLYTRLETPDAVVWDTRSDGEFAGTDVRADRGGHIPGAIHLNWTNLQKEVNGVKVLKSPEEINALLLSHGVTPDKEVIAHCQTGIRSSYATLVLLGLGYQQVKNYDGSWIEWANNKTLPIIDAKGQLNASIPVSPGLASLDRFTSSDRQVAQ
ncbi:hypothetical protein JCM30471_25040 [Desulfuromonas carbonis]|uniref:sulfurtransferase n=1 Tax=Desulfuromonas sp. DDH964 TaxID=1823759 RepID=UPI00078E2F3D|nr:sulfurtransferase [Desulfuromonas sp. DDH964]AMV70511.1 rhodanese-like domain-containing protein [Desulfuromonas sp. DDH964]